MGIKRKIEYVLKHNLIIQSIYKFTFSSIFKFWGLFIKTDSNLVLLSSFGGRRCNDSPRVLYYALKEKKPNMRFVWALENPNSIDMDSDKVKIDSVRYFYLALKAKYWITNVNIERGLHFKKKNTIYINTWHGVPLKLVGNAVSQRKDFDFSNIDIFCASSVYDRDIYQRDMNVKSDSFMMCGMPRNDKLYHVTSEQVKFMKEEMGLPLDKKIILYAPTWRDSENGGESYDIKPPINLDLWKLRLSKDYIIIFRMHYFTTKLIGLQFDDFVIDGTKYVDIDDLMIVSDILISDYSATIFDYSILERPIISFAYDYDQYTKDRGFYMDIEKELPEGICRTEKELLDKIEKIDYLESSSRTKQFKKKFVTYGGYATDSILSKIL